MLVSSRLVSSRLGNRFSPTVLAGVIGAFLSLGFAPVGADAVDAERISQYIDMADVNREFQSLSEARTKNQQASRSNNNKTEAQTTAVKANKPTSSIRDYRRVSVERSSGWLSAKGNHGLTVSIPDTANRAVWLSPDQSRKGASPFVVSLPNQQSTVNAKVTEDDTVVYTSPQQATDVAVQAFEDSARILTILKGVDSPSEYRYTVNLPVGGKIEKLDGGGVIVLDSQGAMVGGFAPPWAVDSDGKTIPTHYEVRANAVVQIVEHLGSNPQYPVVADPWLGNNLISSASWTPGKSPNISLRVNPTAYARSLTVSPVSYSVGAAGWAELTKRYPVTRNVTGMRNQYICHQVAGLGTMFKSS